METRLNRNPYSTLYSSNLGRNEYVHTRESEAGEVQRRAGVSRKNKVTCGKSLRAAVLQLEMCQAHPETYSDLMGKLSIFYVRFWVENVPPGLLHKSDVTDFIAM